MTAPTRIYLAGPLFTHGEWSWNQRLSSELKRRGLDVFLPQERAREMIEGREPFSPKGLFDTNVKEIQKSDAIVAILDGADPDSGTSWECGFAFALGIPVVGVRTDMRAGGDDPKIPVNLMLSVSCGQFVLAELQNRENVAWLADRIADNVHAVISEKAPA
jgi:nucleoside 2-deoxyribosyltransferase